MGVGDWGINHVKTLFSLKIEVGCIDRSQLKLDQVKSLFPQVSCFSTIDESLSCDYDGYIVATPPSSHKEIAKLIMSYSKPVLVEKPLCLSTKDAQSIKSQIAKYDGKLMVGHLMLFHPAIIKIKEIIDAGEIGSIQYIYSNRLNLGKVRKEENVFWSFAPHDISLFQYFSNSFPFKITSQGGIFLQNKIHDTTITYLKYPNGIQGHIYVSWLHPFKEHRLVIIGSKGTVHFEDSLNGKPLLLYEKDSHNSENNIDLKNKTPKIISYEKITPLENEIKHFVKIINGANSNFSGIEKGMDVVKILEMASNSLKG